MPISNSKLITVLKTLSQEELKSFELFLKSPYCNTNKNLPKLVEKIKNYHPKYDSPRLDKEKLFYRILPNGKFSDRRMNNILSEAYLALEQFLIFQNLKKDRQLQQNLLSKEFQNRHLEEQFFKQTQLQIEKLEKKKVKDWEDHLELLTLNRRVYYHPNQIPRIQPSGQTIVKMGEELYLVYLLEKAAIINEKIFRNRILKNENHDIEKELKVWKLAVEEIEHPALLLYKTRFDYTEENMLEQYSKLRNIFLEQYSVLNEREQKTHLSSLINDTIKLIRGRFFDITELLPFYKLGLKSGILLKNGYLSYVRFSAMVGSSNTKKDFEFSNELIEVYSKKIELNAQPDAFFWAKAHTAYYMGNLDRCLEILFSHNFTIKYFLHITKMLTTQAYFDLYLENDSYQAYLFNFFDSFEKWTLREKFNSNHLKKSYLRFIQVCRILAKSYDEVNFKKERIENLLKKESNIQASEWLGRKIKIIIKLKNGVQSKD